MFIILIPNAGLIYLEDNSFTFFLQALQSFFLRLAKNIEGILIDIADAAGHDKFYCIDCNAVLNPKNRNPETRKRDIYFSHYGICPGNLETYLHKLAKQLIEQERKIYLPRLGRVNIDRVGLEQPMKNFIPDALLTDASGQDIIIEIFVTHKTQKVKIEKIKATGLNAFEIDLSGLNYDSPQTQVRSIVIEGLSYKIDLNPPVLSMHGDKDKWLIWVLLTGLLSLIIFRWRNAVRKKRSSKRTGTRFFRRD